MGFLIKAKSKLNRSANKGCAKRQYLDSFCTFVIVKLSIVFLMLNYFVVLTPLNITLFWSVVFLTNRFSSNKARFWLGIFMSMVTLLYACHATYFLGYHELYLQADSLYLFSSLSVYPMYYIYVRLLTCDVGLRKFYFWHFIPAVSLLVAMLMINSFASEEEKSIYFESVLVKNRWPLEESPSAVKAMAAVFFTSRIIFGLQVLIYLGLGYRLLRTYDSRISNFYSNLEGKELVWVKLLTISFFLTSMVSLVANVLGRGVFLENPLLLAVPSLLFSLLFFIIGLQGNKQDHRIKALKKDEDEILISEIGSLPLQKQNNLQHQLLNVLERDKLYLNPDLRVTDLCRSLMTNRTYLSNLMNNELKVNFNDLINQYRVNHAKSLIEEDSTNQFSLGFIAAESGFGSISSFNRAFQKAVGKGPGTYRAEFHAGDGTN
jgi:AraC-like DNA-binding protein